MRLGSLRVSSRSPIMAGAAGRSAAPAGTRAGRVAVVASAAAGRGPRGSNQPMSATTTSKPLHIAGSIGSCKPPGPRQPRGSGPQHSQGVTTSATPPNHDRRPAVGGKTQRYVVDRHMPVRARRGGVGSRPTVDRSVPFSDGRWPRRAWVRWRLSRRWWVATRRRSVQSMPRVRRCPASRAAAATPAVRRSIAPRPNWPLNGSRATSAYLFWHLKLARSRSVNLPILT